MHIINQIGKKTVYYMMLYASLFFALFMMAFSIVLSVKTGLGISPWNVLHTGLLNYLPITLGQASMLTGVVIITISVFLGVRPYIATFLNMFFIGIFTDLVYNWSVFLYIPDNIFARLIIFMISTAILAMGTAIYMGANLKYGPRDGLMIGICNKTKIRIGIIRTILEVTVVLIGWLMGGMFGVGTIIYSLTIGFFLEITLKIVRRFKGSKLFLFFINTFHDWDDKKEEAHALVK